MAKRKYVDVNVSWCNDECSPTTKVSLAEWQKILKGKKVVTGARYWYDGERFSAYFSFNRDGYGSLRVGYGEDGGVGFEGRINDATIVGGVFPADDEEPSR